MCSLTVIAPPHIILILNRASLKGKLRNLSWRFPHVFAADTLLRRMFRFSVASVLFLRQYWH